MRTTLLAIAFFTLPAIAGNFSYLIKNHPAQPKGCHETAADIGARFQQATSIVPTRSRCMEETELGYRIEISYTAEKPVELVSTSKAWGSITGIGRYATIANCQAAMDQEAKIFVEETGLKVALNFCARDGLSGGKNVWYPRIDGFGTAKRTPQMSTYHFFGVPKGIDGPTIRERIFAGLRARGIRPVALVFRSHMAYGDAAVHYYGEDRINLELIEATKVATLEQCEAQNLELAAAYVGHANPPLVHYCGLPLIGNEFELNVLFTGKYPEVRSSSEKFKTFADCEAERSTLVTFYKQTLKLPILLGLCSRGKLERQFSIALFEESSN